MWVCGHRSPFCARILAQLPNLDAATGIDRGTGLCDRHCVLVTRRLDEIVAADDLARLGIGSVGHHDLAVLLGDDAAAVIGELARADELAARGEIAAPGDVTLGDRLHLRWRQT